MICYTDLHARLLNLESSVAGIFETGFSAAHCVRPKLSPVQGFALDCTTKGKNLQVIVAIGANYTQDKQKCPRDFVPGVVKVEDDLQTCRKYLNDALSAVNTAWVSCGKASRALLVPPEYHLVMTNFCLWNTTKRWQNIEPSNRASLLNNNPFFAKSTTAAPSWSHIRTLAKQLNPEPVLWVGHGIHSEVFRLFSALRESFPFDDWVLTPNLSYRYFHYGRCFPR